MEKKLTHAEYLKQAIQYFVAVTIAVGLLCLVACNVKPAEADPEQFKVQMRFDNNYYRLSYEPVVLEGCQYFATPSAYGFISLCHKGNCTNIIHVYNYMKPIELAGPQWKPVPQRPK